MLRQLASTLAVGFGLALICPACDCVAPSVKESTAFASAVFAGRVVEKKELAPRKDGRRRYAVRFSVKDRWKGDSSVEVVVYDAAPAGDCEGFGFEAGKDYVVFARRRAVLRDTAVHVDGKDLVLQDIWNDVLPIGSKILIGEICTHTAGLNSRAASEAIVLLGPPQHSR